MTRYLLAIICLGLFLCTSCVPQKDLIYLQDKGNSNDTIPSLVEQQKPYRVQINDILNIRINFWIICSLALIWNLIGVIAYFGQTFMSEEILSSLSKTEQNYFLNMPVWVTASFATAVFTGVFGAISLLLKKKPAVFLFLISIILILKFEIIFEFFI